MSKKIQHSIPAPDSDSARHPLPPTLLDQILTDAGLLQGIHGARIRQTLRKEALHPACVYHLVNHSYRLHNTVASTDLLGRWNRSDAPLKSFVDLDAHNDGDLIELCCGTSRVLTQTLILGTVRYHDQYPTASAMQLKRAIFPGIDQGLVDTFRRGETGYVDTYQRNYDFYHLQPKHLEPLIPLLSVVAAENRYLLTITKTATGNEIALRGKILGIRKMEDFDKRLA